jgi:hypothetical protein
MVIFDYHGSGKDKKPAAKLEDDVVGQLTKNGWPRDDVACIVVER